MTLAAALRDLGEAGDPVLLGEHQDGPVADLLVVVEETGDDLAHGVQWLDGGLLLRAKGTDGLHDERLLVAVRAEHGLDGGARGGSDLLEGEVSGLVGEQLPSGFEDALSRGGGFFTTHRHGVASSPRVHVSDVNVN